MIIVCSLTQFDERIDQQMQPFLRCQTREVTDGALAGCVRTVSVVL